MLEVIAAGHPLALKVVIVVSHLIMMSDLVRYNNHLVRSNVGFKLISQERSIEDILKYCGEVNNWEEFRKRATEANVELSFLEGSTSVTSSDELADWRCG